MAKKKKVITPQEGSHGPQHGDSPFAQEETDIFEHFALERPAHMRKAEAAESEATAKVDQAALLAKIEELTGTVKSLQERQQVPSYYQPPQHQQQTVHVDPAKMRFDPSGLPDPITDKHGYDQQLAERINAVVEARALAVRDEVTREVGGRVDRAQMWDNFKQANPQWSQYPELVATVAEQLARQVQASGGNAQQYMFGTTNAFYQDLNKELTAKYGPLVKKPDANDEEEDETPEPVGRTQVLGGLESGGKASDPAQRGKKQPKGYLEDLQDIQRAMGLY